jgi:hypothetical protein
MTTRLAVVHKFITRRGPFGGTVATTICGRLRESVGDNGWNSTGADDLVTCKFCLKRMKGHPQADYPLPVRTDGEE